MAEVEDESAALGPAPETAPEELAHLISEAVDALLDSDAKRVQVTFDRAAEVVAEIGDEAVRTPLELYISSYRSWVEGMLELGHDGDLNVARARFARAKRRIDKLLKNHAGMAQAVDATAFANVIDHGLLDVELAAATDDAERARLLRRREDLSQITMGSDTDAGVSALWRALQLWGTATTAFRDSSAALARFDLEEARRRLDHASQAADELRKTAEAGSRENEMLSRGFSTLCAVTPLLSAQQSYVSVLHELIVGDARPRHLELLDAADEELRQGLAELTDALDYYDRLIGQILGPSPQAELVASVEQQRVVLRNLRRLVRDGLTPGEVTRRSAPRFAGYFLIAFVVLFAGIRISGIAEKISGTELLSILLIALVVAAGSSFGWEAAIRLFEAMPFARKQDREVPPTSPHAA